MAPRLDLDALLRVVLGSGNVYFQSPPTNQMEYPCIRYELDNVDTSHADNKPYAMFDRYLVTVIHRNPDQGKTLSDKVGLLETASFSRSYKADGLNHFVHTLFF